MTATIHTWMPRPIVTLTSEYWTWQTEWHGGDAQSFKGGFQNVLKLQVEFKYKKPYGGSARYRVVIDRNDGAAWTNVVTDEPGFYPDASDNEWHTATKEYELTKSFPLFLKRDVVLLFRISSQIEGPGHLPTGSGPGSPGPWSPPEVHEYRATFEKPTLHLVRAEVEYVQGAMREALKEYERATR